MVSAKNFALSPAATTLGLGDQTKMALEDDLEERKKKLLLASKLSPTPNLLGLSTGSGMTPGY